MRKWNFVISLLLVSIGSTSCAFNKPIDSTSQNLEESVITTSFITETSLITTSSTTMASTSTTSVTTTEPITTTESVTTIESVITTEITTEEIIVTEIPFIEPTLNLEDTLLIRDSIINLTYTYPTQEEVNNNDVVYPIGYIFNQYTENEHIKLPEEVYPNTVLFGHNYKSFSILHLLNVGETFEMNVHGQQTTYEIQRSEEAYLSETNTRVFYYSDNSDILFTDYGYTALILFTCSDNGRWIIVAKPL